MLCDPCVSACALLSFALKAPILGTGLANLKTTTFTPRYRNYFHRLDHDGESQSPNPLFTVAFVDGGLLFVTLQKSEQVVVFRLDCLTHTGL